MKQIQRSKTYQLAAIPVAIALSLGLTSFQAVAVQVNTPTNQTATKLKPYIPQKQIVKEAADAFKATQVALRALNNDQPKQAQAALTVASGNLHLLLSRDPTLGMVPIDIQVQVIEGVHDLKLIKQLEDKLEDLIDDGLYQTARPIMDSLVDELRVTTVYLPLATYPAAIDKIAPLIDAGQIEVAKQALIDVLDSFVVEEEVTPIAIIKAEEKLSAAFQIEHKGDLKNQKTIHQIEQLIDSAEQDIKVAQALGYGTKKDYAVLYDGIDALKKAIGESGFKGAWHKLEKSLSKLKNKIVHPIS